MKTLFFLASVMVILFIAAPNKIGAQKKSAATPSAEAVANFYFQNRVTSQSGGALSPSGFRKTNGYESGFGMYVLEWQADVVAMRDCFKFAYTGDWLWKNFAVTDRGVGGLDALVMQTSPLSQGTRVRLTGTATFRKTEKGPRLEAFDVKTSQVLGRVAATPPKPISKPKIPAPAFSNKAVIAMLESSWNFYKREEIFLGPTYFGNATNGRGLALMSDYPTYQALATKGLIKLDELSLVDAPKSEYGSTVSMGATVSMTEAGSKLGKVDPKANTVTFVFGTYRVEKIESNTIINTNAGNYRLVTGTHLLDIAPAFADMWTNLNWPTYRERRFRAIFVYEGYETTRSDGSTGRTAPSWHVATASNGRFSAEDVGTRDGDFESNNVPPTFDQLGGGRMPVAASKQSGKPKTIVKPASRISQDAALIAAVTKGDVVAARAALTKGANVEAKDERGMMALIYAAELGRLEIVQALLAKGARVDAKDSSGATALGRAALWGHLSVVEALISKGADVNAGGVPDSEGILGPTPLTWAAGNGHFEIVQLLLAKGADPNKKGGVTNATPLIHAAGGGFSARKIPPDKSLQIVNALLDKGAELNVKDTYPWTALMHAAREGHLPIVDALLAKGADINAKDNAGHTSLMLAAMQGQTATVRRLLEKGANVKAKNTEGKTALDIANSNGHTEVARILREFN